MQRFVYLLLLVSLQITAMSDEGQILTPSCRERDDEPMVNGGDVIKITNGVNKNKFAWAHVKLSELFEQFSHCSQKKYSLISFVQSPLVAKYLKEISQKKEFPAYVIKQYECSTNKRKLELLLNYARYNNELATFLNPEDIWCTEIFDRNDRSFEEAYLHKSWFVVYDEKLSAESQSTSSTPSKMGTSE